MGRPDIEKMEQKRDVRGLIRVLKHEEDPSVRFEIREALARIGEPVVVPLIRALKDVYMHVHVRWGAASVLREIGEPAVEPLIQVLKDADAWGRECAAWALGEIGDERAVEPLTQALKDEEGAVREAAKNALREIKAKKR